MRTRKVSRDNFWNEDSNYSDLVDYEFSLVESSSSRTESYYDNQKTALVNLIKTVIDEELTERQRDIVVLVKIKGLTSKEVAETLCINPSTVCRHLKAAQKKFDRAYQHFGSVKRAVLVKE